MESFNKQKWEDLNLSRDEVRSIGQALKKEEFRNLLAEYVKEINDPDNRRQYEEDIIQLENERGVDVKFVHPTSGYVIKTSVNGKSKAFVNICSNDNVGVPSSSPELEDGNKGACWSIPYCLAPPREDLDKKKTLCTVYDVVFHSETLNLTKNNGKFKKLVNDTALGAIEDNFNVSLDKVNLKFPKMQFKGLKHATVIRKKLENVQSTDLSDIPNYPLPPLKNDVLNYTGCPEKSKTKISETLKCNKDSNFTTPNYTIKHRNTIDMQNFTNDPMCKMLTTVPNELVITIDLPLLKCSSDVSIDVLEKSFTLVSEKPAKYKLDLSLPYSVDSNRGCAKFDMTKKVLVITLPVKNRNGLHNIDLTREDSGVESDNGYGRSSTSSNEEDDSLVTENQILSKNECCNTEGNVIVARESLLRPNLHYALPNYLCNYLKDVIVFTLQVPNVNPDSVKYCFLDEGFHLIFASVGAGFFPVHYAFCFKLPPHNKIKNDTLSVEVWDENVVAQVTLISMPGVILTEYFIGTDQDSTEKCLFPITIEHETQDKIKITELPEHKIEKVSCKQEKCDESVSISESKEDEIKIPKSICNEDIKHSSVSENKNQSQEEDPTSSEVNKSENKNADELLKDDLYVSESTPSFDESTISPQRLTAKSRTLSECQQGEVKRSKNRGILKLGRSLSESSVDDYASWSTEKTEKTKKTVRFSEVISKQVFRMNSSILGQRKKNQRKTRNKKRAQERRLSESGNESEGDGEFSEIKAKLQENDWLNEPESSSCDISEVSDVSDISESDDGQKENGPPSLPCSSRKNHKRRGKKSARKNAATAKFNYMEY